MNLQRGEENGLRLVVMIISCKDQCSLRAAQADSRYWGKAEQDRASDLAGRMGGRKGNAGDDKKGRRGGGAGGCGGCGGGNRYKVDQRRCAGMLALGIACWLQEIAKHQLTFNRWNSVLRVNTSVAD